MKIYPSGAEPIFIVGAPRSGTTLLSAMLTAHSRISCGPETRFFHFLSRADHQWLLQSWPAHAIDFLYSITLMQPIPEHYAMTVPALHQYLAAHTPSISVILTALTEQLMHRQGKVRWAEKSPEHLKQVATIRTYFPQAPIVRIVRDPRDAALSMMKTPWAPQTFIDALLFWYEYDAQSVAFFEQDHYCYTLRYEDLVINPAAELSQLCHFLGEPYEAQMLNTAMSAAQVVTQEERWKGRVNKPVDESRIQVWKRELSEEENCLAEALIGNRLHAYNYECIEQLPYAAHLYPSLHALAKHREQLVVLVHEGVRFWLMHRQEKPQFRVYVGEPTTDEWLRVEKPGRWWDTFIILLTLVRTKLAQQRVLWIRDASVSHSASRNVGCCNRLVAFTCQVVGESEWTTGTLKPKATYDRMDRLTSEQSQN